MCCCWPSGRPVVHSGARTRALLAHPKTSKRKLHPKKPRWLELSLHDQQSCGRLWKSHSFQSSCLLEQDHVSFEKERGCYVERGLVDVSRSWRPRRSCFQLRFLTKQRFRLKAVIGLFLEGFFMFFLLNMNSEKVSLCIPGKLRRSRMDCSF